MGHEHDRGEDEDPDEDRRDAGHHVSEEPDKRREDAPGLVFGQVNRREDPDRHGDHGTQGNHLDRPSDSRSEATAGGRLDERLLLSQETQRQLAESLSDDLGQDQAERNNRQQHGRDHRPRHDLATPLPARERPHGRTAPRRMMSLAAMLMSRVMTNSTTPSPIRADLNNGRLAASLNWSAMVAAIVVPC